MEAVRVATELRLSGRWGRVGADNELAVVVSVEEMELVGLLGNAAEDINMPINLVDGIQIAVPVDVAPAPARSHGLGGEAIDLPVQTLRLPHPCSLLPFWRYGC